MTQRFRRFVLLAIVLAILPLCAGAQAPECSWKGVERIVAVGDVHGDYDRFVTLLRAADVVNDQNTWIGEKTHLVQTGDILDRGPDSKKAMNLLMQLEKEAGRAGGQVHALIGNHEAMVMFGLLTYVHPGELESFGGRPGILRALGPGGEYGKWILGHNAAIRINDILFVHGGISPGYTNQPLQKINDAVRKELAGGREVEKGIAMSADGPLWYRGYTLKPESEVTKDLMDVLKAFDVRHAVVGHTVSKEGIQTRCGGLLIMIDVGLSSHYYGGPAECLLIEKGKFFIVTPKSKKPLAVSTDPAPEEKRVPGPDRAKSKGSADR